MILMREKHINHINHNLSQRSVLKPILSRSVKVSAGRINNTSHLEQLLPVMSVVWSILTSCVFEKYF